MIITQRMLLFILIVLMGSIECRKQKAAGYKFISISSIPNTQFLEYCNVSITPGSNGRSFDLNSNLLTIITKDLNIGLFFYMKSKKETEYKEFFAYDFNFCRLMEGFMSQTIARIWFTNLKRFSNIPTSCPIHKGVYYIRKMRVDRKSMPMVAISGVYLAKVHMYVQKGSSVNTIANTSLELEIDL